MNDNDIKELFDRYRSGTATEADKALLESWYLQFDGPAGEVEVMSMEQRLAAVDTVWANLNSGEDRVRVRMIGRWPRVAAAACILLLLSTGGWFLTHRHQAGSMDTAHLAGTPYDIAPGPGSNKATLTLANGKIIPLSTTQRGVVVGADALTYNDGSEVGTTSAGQATLTTPIGGSYQLRLPDGSRVWLNAASSITFPSSFAGLSQRKVVLKGEAYFEVAANKDLPFRVASTGQEVEVLGTHFDINCYADELVTRTTLLEGSVRIGSAVLQPGQQGVRNEDGIKVRTVNTEEVTGWKNNYIIFEDEKIESVMRKIARWYDVDVVYEGERPTDDFGGRVSRSAYVSQVLKKLELTNKVHFTIVGRRLIVQK